MCRIATGIISSRKLLMTTIRRMRRSFGRTGVKLRVGGGGVDEWALQRADLDVPPFAEPGVLLQRDLSFIDLCKVCEYLVAKFAGGDHAVPVVAADLSVEGSDSIQPGSDMTVVLDEADLVPFADGMWSAHA